MPIPRRFVKMSGGGNDFLVFEADGRALSEPDRERVARLCRRGVSVGADGALFLSGGESSRIHLDYFNSDGRLELSYGDRGFTFSRSVAVRSHAPADLRDGDTDSDTAGEIERRSQTHAGE